MTDIARHLRRVSTRFRNKVRKVFAHFRHVRAQARYFLRQTLPRRTGGALRAAAVLDNRTGEAPARLVGTHYALLRLGFCASSQRGQGGADPIEGLPAGLADMLPVVV